MENEKVLHVLKFKMLKKKNGKEKIFRKIIRVKEDLSRRQSSSKKGNRSTPASAPLLPLYVHAHTHIHQTHASTAHIHTQPHTLTTKQLLHIRTRSYTHSQHTSIHYTHCSVSVTFDCGHTGAPLQPRT